MTLAAPALAQEGTIAEIRVHGNHTTADADILALAGLSLGQAAGDAQLKQAAARLEQSHRFEGVEVLRRYRSIANESEILVMLVVDERPAVSEIDLTPGPIRKLRAATMWMPLLNHADGYGFTYGAQLALIEPLGPRTRLSVPLTWGGERHAAVELERTFDSGPVDSIRGTFSATRRVNPFHLASDRRFEAKVRGDRAITNWLRAGAGARLTGNTFGSLDDRTRSVQADITFDTRVDPSFPRNAVYAATGIERMAFNLGDATRWTTDLRGYIGVGGSAVLALRGSTSRSDAVLPRFEQALLGGSSSVRGYRTGHRAGDNVASMSAELRYPLNPPLRASRFGVKGFVDAGTAWTSGGSWKATPLARGIGGGIYAGGGPIILDLDVAWPRSGNPRAHFGLGVSF
jgi:outer membrane protein assembly factor BamA